MKRGSSAASATPAAEAVETKAPRERVKKPSAAKAAIKKVESGPVRRTAASILEILGFDPENRKEAVHYDRRAVRKEWLKNYDALVAMRDELQSRLAVHRAETLRKDEGDMMDRPNMLGQHTADGAADHMDIERALTFVENEQELLEEVSAALARIFRGTYGACEQTGKPIDGKRLDAIPFARFSLEGQREHEEARKWAVAARQTGGALFQSGDSDGEPLIGGDGDGEE